MKQETKEKVKNLIIKAELKEAISLLLKSDLSKSTKQDVEILYSRLNELDRRSREGILKEDDYVIERNKIRREIFIVLDKETDNSNASIANIPSISNPSYAKYALLLVTPILIALFFLPNLMKTKEMQGETESKDTTSAPTPKEESIKNSNSTDKKVAGTQPANKVTTLPTPPVKVEKKAANTKPEIKKEDSANNLEKLFNNKFLGTIAIVDLDKKNGTSNILNDFLKGEKFNSTTSFFRSVFFSKYKSVLWQQDIEVLEKLPLPNNLRCACLLKEKVEYRESERFGEVFTVAKGEVELKIINIPAGETTSLKIPVGGSGADERRAYESFQENFTAEIIKNNHQNQFTACKN